MSFMDALDLELSRLYRLFRHYDLAKPKTGKMRLLETYCNYSYLCNGTYAMSGEVCPFHHCCNLQVSDFWILDKN